MCAMAQAVSRRHVMTEARFYAYVRICGICSAQSGIGTDISPSSSVFPCQYHSTMAFHTHISSRIWTVGPLVAAVQRYRLTPSKRITWTTITTVACSECTCTVLCGCCDGILVWITSVCRLFSGLRRNAFRMTSRNSSLTVNSCACAYIEFLAGSFSLPVNSSTEYKQHMCNWQLRNCHSPEEKTQLTWCPELKWMTQLLWLWHTVLFAATEM